MLCPRGIAREQVPHPSQPCRFRGCRAYRRSRTGDGLAWVWPQEPRFNKQAPKKRPPNVESIEDQADTRAEHSPAPAPWSSRKHRGRRASCPVSSAGLCSRQVPWAPASSVFLGGGKMSGPPISCTRTGSSQGARMSSPQKVYDFLKTNPRQLFCDDCIEKATGVDRDEVKSIALTLALFPREFTRISTQCIRRCNDRDKECTMAL